MAACWEAVGALREAELGHLEFVLERTRAAPATSSGRPLDAMGAFLLARCGDTAGALALADKLSEEYPHDTVIHRYWLPCMHAAIAIGKREWKVTMEALEAARALELGHTKPFEYGMLLTVWLRSLVLESTGQAAAAARERARILERPGLVKNFTT